MKHICLVSMTLLIAASCSLNGIDETPGPLDRAPERVYATIADPGNDQTTRVYLGEDLRLYWNADDRISYFDKEIFNYEYRFEGSSGDRKGTFKKVKSVFHSSVEISHVRAVYPYDSRNAVDEDDESMTVFFPENQAYADNSFGSGANIMVAVGDDENLMFKNAGAYLCIKLYGSDVSVSSIGLSGNDGEAVAGKATVTMEPGGLPETVMDASASKTVKVACDNPVTLGNTKEDYTSFWFVVPPVTFCEGFTLTVTDAGGRTFTKTTSKSFALKRNSITSMAPLEVDFQQ